MPEVLGRSDDETGARIFVKRAKPDEVCAVAMQLHSARLDQALDRDLPLDPLQLTFSNSRHFHLLHGKGGPKLVKHFLVCALQKNSCRILACFCIITSTILRLAPPAG